MWVAKTIDQARQDRAQLRGEVALVPTMGALHRGHRWLIEKAKEAGGPVLVSLFVNPTQFNESQDYIRYPRQMEQDLDLCKQAGVAGVFCPSEMQMYPPGQLGCEVTVPDLATLLEGEHRPGHFEGVCRVVAKLFHIIEPDLAVFGQKDYQQLQVIRAMVADLAMPVRMVGVPTVREEDGLAVSSRNVRLVPEHRRRATALYKALSTARMLVEQDGESDPGVVENSMRRVLETHQVGVDYAVIRHPKTLVSLDCIEPELTSGVIALVAGRLGEVRLIDNMLLGVPKDPDIT